MPIQIHYCSTDLGNEDIDCAPLADGLCPADRERYDRIFNRRRQLQFVAGRLLLTCTARRAGYPAKPADIAVNAFGQPCFSPWPDLAAAITHSGSYVAAACGPGLSLGIDSERHNASRSLIDIARRMFGDSAAEELAAAPETKQTDLFYQRWTQYEARLKAHLPADTEVHVEHWQGAHCTHCVLTSVPVEIVVMHLSADELVKTAA